MADFEIEKDEMLCNQKNHFEYFIGDNLFKLEQNLKQKTKSMENCLSSVLTIFGLCACRKHSVGRLGQ